MTLHANDNSGGFSFSYNKQLPDLLHTTAQAEGVDCFSTDPLAAHCRVRLPPFQMFISLQAHQGLHVWRHCYTTIAVLTGHLHSIQMELGVHETASQRTDRW